MLLIKLIDNQATLNNFHYLASKEYVPNKPLIIKLQIIDIENSLRVIPATTATCDAIFQLRDGTSLTIACTMLFNPDDRSLWQISLTAPQTNDIVGGNFEIDLDMLGDDSDIRVGIAENLLSKIILDGEC